MLKLIFFTTNRVKLAHARYMAEGHPVIVESFRRKTFYASYTEPKIDSRDDLLERSYQSALEQAQSSGINPNKRFFFLEDTSVVSPSEATGYSILKDKMNEVLGTLTEREKRVLIQRFGLADGKPKTLEEVGVEFNVTRERIRQIEAKALRKMRHPTRSKQLKAFLDLVGEEEV